MTVNRYLIGERNELHSDWTDIKNSRYNDRLITVNTILNDSFKGGDLIVGNTIIQQKTGHTFYHNSKILHEVTEVTDGERYTLVCFINNKDIITKKHLM
jgi:predicted 2-oxoglutarate/Fe(II)-dependent dioxygenase YbiX